MSEETDLAKLEELMLYIICKCQDKPTFGKTVLFKLLYFSDFNFYKDHYCSITNEKYRRIPNGPAPTHFDKTLVNLVQKGLASYSIKEYAPNKEQWQFKCNVPSFKPKLFSPVELELVDRVLERLGSLNATTLTNISHRDNPWKSSKENNIIDYDLVFYRDERLEKEVE